MGSGWPRIGHPGRRRRRYCGASSRQIRAGLPAATECHQQAHSGDPETAHPSEHTVGALVRQSANGPRPFQTFAGCVPKTCYEHWP